MTLDVEQMQVYATFPYPDVGVIFRTKVLDIVFADNVLNDKNGDLTDKDLEDLADRISAVIVTESRKKKRTSGKRLNETRKGTKKLSEILKRAAEKTL